MSEMNQNVDTTSNIDDVVVQPQGQVANVQETTPAQVDTQPTTALEFEIDGVGKVTPDQIKEWQRGNMRQQDYTRKTQEIAREKAEIKDALEVFNFLKSNPAIAQQVASGDYSGLVNSPVAKSINPVTQQLEEINLKFASLELDGEISRLKSKYDDFDEVEVLNEADRRGIADLEFIYNALQGSKVPTMRDQLMKEIKASLTDEIRKNGLATQTIISGNDTAPVVDSGLTADEKLIAQKMGISYEQYAKGKQY